MSTIWGLEVNCTAYARTRRNLVPGKGPGKHPRDLVRAWYVQMATRLKTNFYNSNLNMERLGVVGLKICLYCFITTSKRIVTMYFLFDYNIMNSILTIAISKLGSFKLELSIELKWRWYLQ